MDDLLLDAPTSTYGCNSVEDLKAQLTTIHESKVLETKAEHISVTFEFGYNVVFNVPENDHDAANASQSLDLALGGALGASPGAATGAPANGKATKASREIRAHETLVNQPPDDPTLQNLVARHILTFLGSVDGSLYMVRSVSRDPSGWIFTYICKHSTQAWMRQNSKHAEKVVVGESSGKDGLDPVNLSRPAFDCRGSVTIAFVKNTRTITVKLEHTVLHKTVAELSGLLKPPSPPPVARISSCKHEQGKKRNAESSPEGAEERKEKARRTNPDAPEADSERWPGPKKSPKPKTSRTSKSKRKQATKVGIQNVGQDSTLLNLSPSESARRKEDAHRKLLDNGLDPATLSPEQFDIFANQSPDLQAESLSMILKYGAERLRIVHPEKDETPTSGLGTSSNPATLHGSSRSRKSRRISTNPDGTPRVRKTRGSCQACRTHKTKCSKAKPNCLECVEAGITCYYPPEQKRQQKGVKSGAEVPAAKVPTEVSEEVAEVVLVEADPVADMVAEMGPAEVMPLEVSDEVPAEMVPTEVSEEVAEVVLVEADLVADMLAEMGPAEVMALEVSEEVPAEVAVATQLVAEIPAEIPAEMTRAEMMAIEASEEVLEEVADEEVAVKPESVARQTVPEPEDDASDLGSPGFSTSHPTPLRSAASPAETPGFPEVSPDVPQDLYQPTSTDLSYRRGVSEDMYMVADYVRQHHPDSTLISYHQSRQQCIVEYPDPLVAAPYQVLEPRPQPEPQRTLEPKLERLSQDHHPRSLKIMPVSSRTGGQPSLSSGSGKNQNGYSSPGNADHPDDITDAYSGKCPDTRGRSPRSQSRTALVYSTLQHGEISATTPAQSAAMNRVSDYHRSATAKSNNISSYDEYSHLSSSPTPPPPPPPPPPPARPLSSHARQQSSRVAYEPCSQQAMSSNASASYPSFGSYTTEWRASNSSATHPVTQPIISPYTKAAGPKTHDWPNITSGQNGHSYGSGEAASLSSSACHMAAPSEQQQSSSTLSCDVLPQSTAPHSRENRNALAFCVNQQHSQAPKQQQQQQQQQSYESLGQIHRTPDDQHDWFGSASSSGQTHYGSGTHGQQHRSMSIAGNAYIDTHD